MKSLKAFQPPAVNELQLSVNIEGCCIKFHYPLSINIEGCCIKGRKLMLYSDVFNATDLILYHKQMTLKSLDNGAGFICAGFSFVQYGIKSQCFVFDSHFQDRNSCHVPNGQSVLLGLRSVDISNSFIIKYFWVVINSYSMSLQYHVKHIEVDISDTNVENILTSFRYQRKVNCNKAYKKRKSELIEENTPLVKIKFHEQPPSHSVSQVDIFLEAAKKRPIFVSFVIGPLIQEQWWSLNLINMILI